MIKQQFTLPVTVCEELEKLSNSLGKKRANDLKIEILTAFSRVPPEAYYIALGEIQKAAAKTTK